MWVSVAAMEGSSSGGGSGVGVGLGARPASLDPRASLYALRSAVEMLQSGQSIETVSYIRTLTKIKESLEITLPRDEFVQVMRNLVPLLSEIIQTRIPPDFVIKNNEVHKIRSAVLEIFNRVPWSQIPLDEPVYQTLDTCLHILENDNEENAISAVKVLGELYRTHRTSRGSLHVYAERFLDCVVRYYSSFVSIVEETLGTNTHAVSEAAESIVDRRHPIALPASMSFKVLTECPVIVVLLSQMLPSVVEDRLDSLLDNMESALSVIFTVPSDVPSPLRSIFAEFVSSEVKTTSFLTFAFRSLVNSQESKFKDRSLTRREVPHFVVQLLSLCPPEASASRKDLFIITRHILDLSDMREHFVDYLDSLLDDRVLIGSDQYHNDAIRPLAFSTLADLIHHIRDHLSPTLITKVIAAFRRNMFDDTLALTFHSMSAKLLLHLVEQMCRDKENFEENHLQLLRIFITFTDRLGTLAHSIEDLTKEFQDAEEQLKKSPDNVEAVYLRETVSEKVREFRVMLRTLINGLQRVISIMSQMRLDMMAQNRTHPGCPHLIAFPDTGLMTQLQVSGEGKLYQDLFRNGVRCFSLFTIGNVTSSEERRTLGESFAQLFTCLDQKSFVAALQGQMDFLKDSIVSHSLCLIIPTNFLGSTSENLALEFADLLLKYLVEHIGSIEGFHKEALVMLRLFKLVIMFTTSGQGPTRARKESFLKPYVAPIISGCLARASEKRSCWQYVLILRYLFRQIGAAKSELLQEEYRGHLGYIVERLSQLAGNSERPLRDLYIELCCLLIPTCTPTMLPYLPTLFRHLVEGLHNTSSELMGLALRTLEIWVDGLKPDCLEHLVAPFKAKLMKVLFSHLRPAPYAWGPLSLRILGKMGGRNRKLHPAAFYEGTERPTDELGRDGIFQLMSSYPSNGTGVQAHGLSSLEVTQAMNRLGSMAPSGIIRFRGNIGRNAFTGGVFGRIGDESYLSVHENILWMEIDTSSLVSNLAGEASWSGGSLTQRSVSSVEGNTLFLPVDQFALEAAILLNNADTSRELKEASFSLVCGALSTYLSLHSVSLQKLSWYSSVDEEGDVLSREDIMIRGFETLTFGPVPHSGATHNDWRWMNASDEEIASFVPQSHPWGVRFPLEGDEGEDIEEMEVDADQVFAPSSSINVSRRCVLLLTAVIQCVENPHESVRQSARDFMDGLARHFAFLYVSSAGARVATSGGNAASNNNNQIHPDCFLDALIEAYTAMSCTPVDIPPSVLPGGVVRARRRDKAAEEDNSLCASAKEFRERKRTGASHPSSVPTSSERTPSVGDHLEDDFESVDAALWCVQKLWSNFEDLFQNFDMTVWKQKLCMAMWTRLCSRLCQLCCSSRWQTQLAGTVGLRHLVQLLPADWCRSHCGRILSALFYAIRECPSIVSVLVMQSAQEVVLSLLRKTVAAADSLEEEEQRVGQEDFNFDTQSCAPHECDLEEELASLSSLGGTCSMTERILYPGLSGKRRAVLFLAVSTLLKNCCSFNAAVQETVSKGLSLASSLSGIPEGRLVEPLVPVLRSSFRSFSSRNMLLPVQIGIAQGLAFLLQLKPPSPVLTMEECAGILHALLGRLCDPDSSPLQMSQDLKAAAGAPPGQPTSGQAGAAGPSHAGSSSSPLNADDRSVEEVLWSMEVEETRRLLSSAESDGIPQTFDWAQGYHGFYAHQVQEFTGGWGAQSCRMATIDLLDAFLDNLENRGMHDSADFPADVLRRLVDQLFRSLSHPCKRVIQRAKLGLAKLLKHQIIPKEQVQQCTRPFLLPLGKPQSLTLEAVDTLEHVLELCAGFFNVKLGDQILNNLERWRAGDELPFGEPAQRIALIIKLLRLFRLLPPEALKLTDKLVNITIELEHIWFEHCALTHNPFVKPLSLFLNRFPDTSVQCFLMSLSKCSHDAFRLFLNVLELGEVDSQGEATNDHGHMLAYLIKSPHLIMHFGYKLTRSLCPVNVLSVPDADIRSDFATVVPIALANSELFVKRTVELSEDAIAIMLAKIVDIACKKCPKWLSAPQCRPIVMALCAHWSRVAAPACTPEGFPQVTYLGDRFLPELQACERALEAELVARCLISYARAALNLSPGTGDSNTVEGGATTSSGGDMDVDAPATDSCQMAFVIASETFSAEQAEAFEYVDPYAVLLSLTRVFCFSSLYGAVDFSFLRKFLANEFCQQSSVEHKRALLSYFLARLRFLDSHPESLNSADVPIHVKSLLSFDSQMASRTLSVMLEDLLLPVLSSNQEHVAEIVTPEFGGQVVETMFMEDRFAGRVGISNLEDILAEQILRFAAEIVKHSPSSVEEHRRELIHYTSKFFKSLQPTIRNLSHLLSVFYIKYFPGRGDPIVILRMFTVLMRSHQPEGKQILCQALDLLLPELPGRFPQDSSPLPKWVNFTRFSMQSEIGSPPSLAHILSTICRHPSVYFPYRHHFVTTILNCMTRANLLGTNMESRSLTVDLAELMIAWARMYREEAESKVRIDEGVAGRRRQRGEGSSSSEHAAAEEGAEEGGDEGFGLQPPVKRQKVAGVDAEASGSVASSSSSVAGSSSSPQMAWPGDEEGDKDGLRSSIPADMSPQFCATVLEFLVRMGAPMVEVGSRRGQSSQDAVIMMQAQQRTSRRCIALLGEALDLWPNADPKLAFIDRLMSQLDSVEKRISILCTLDSWHIQAAIDILVEILKRKSRLRFVFEQAHRIFEFLVIVMRTMVYSHPELDTSFLLVLQHLLVAFPPGSDAAKRPLPTHSAADLAGAADQHKTRLTTSRQVSASSSMETLDSYYRKLHEILIPEELKRAFVLMEEKRELLKQINQQQQQVQQPPHGRTVVQPPPDSTMSQLSLRHDRIPAIGLSVCGLLRAAVLLAKAFVLCQGGPSTITMENLRLSVEDHLVPADDSEEALQAQVEAVEDDVRASIGFQNWLYLYVDCLTDLGAPVLMDVISEMSIRAQMHQLQQSFLQCIPRSRRDCFKYISTSFVLHLLGSFISSSPHPIRHLPESHQSVISKAFDAIKTMVECLQRSSVDYPPHVITSALRCAQNIVFSRVLLSPSAAMDFFMKLATCCRCDSTYVRQTYWRMLLDTARPPAYEFFGAHAETLLMMVVRHVLVPLPTQREALELLVDKSSEMLRGCGGPSEFPMQVLSQVLSLTNWEAVSDLKWGRYAAHMLYALLVDSMLPSTPSTGDAQDASSVEKRASLPLPTWMNPQFLTTLSTTPDLCVEADSEVSPALEDFYRRHESFLRSCRAHASSRSMVDAIGVLVDGDIDSASRMFSILFTHCWQRLLDVSQRRVLLPVLQRILDRGSAPTTMRGPQSKVDFSVESPEAVSLLLWSLHECAMRSNTNPLVWTSGQVVDPRLIHSGPDSVPAVSIHLLCYLAKMNRAWDQVLPVLHHFYVSGVNLNQQELLGQVHTHREEVATQEEFKERVVQGIVDLYENLGEGDLSFGVWQHVLKYGQRPMHPLIGEPTIIIKSLESCGLLQRAQETLVNYMKSPDVESCGVSQLEMQCWEDTFVNLCRGLQQWDELLDVSRTKRSSAVVQEALWHKGRFTSLLQNMGVVLPNPSLGREYRDLNPGEAHNRKMQLMEAYLQAVNMGSHCKDVQANMVCFMHSCAFLIVQQMDEADVTAKMALQLSLRKWHSLPFATTTSHFDMLHHFQQIIELQESLRIISEISRAIPPRTGNPNSVSMPLQEIKANLHTWRERLPNSWESANFWSGIVIWRSHIFQTMLQTLNYLMKNTSHISSSTLLLDQQSQLAELSSIEAAWNMNKFAHEARKQRLVDVCVVALSEAGKLLRDANTNKRNPDNLNAERFIKIYELAKCHLQGYPDTLNSGLKMLSVAKVEKFTHQQKAEVLRLKAMMCGKLGRKDDAHKIFSQAIQCAMHIAKTWLSWGKFCNSVWIEDHPMSPEVSSSVPSLPGGEGPSALQLPAAAVGPDPSANGSSSSSSSASQPVAPATGNGGPPSATTWASYVVNCYMQAVRYGSENGRMYIARVLWLLTHDQASVANLELCKALERSVRDLPPWIWLPWYQHLLHALHRPEGQLFATMLQNVGCLYPQAVFYSIHTYLKMIRSTMNKVGAGVFDESNPLLRNASETARMLEDIIRAIQSTHVDMMLSVVQTISSITQQLRPYAEDVLMRDLHAILQTLLSDDLFFEERVPTWVFHQLEGALACLRPSSLQQMVSPHQLPSGGSRPAPSNALRFKHSADALDALRSVIHDDLQEDSFPASLRSWLALDSDSTPAMETDGVPSMEYVNLVQLLIKWIRLLKENVTDSVSSISSFATSEHPHLLDHSSTSHNPLVPYLGPAPLRRNSAAAVPSATSGAAFEATASSVPPPAPVNAPPPATAQAPVFGAGAGPGEETSSSSSGSGPSVAVGGGGGSSSSSTTTTTSSSSSSRRVRDKGGFNGEVEIPGAYTEVREPSMDQHPRLVKISADVEVVRRRGLGCHRFIMLCHQGNEHPFFVHEEGPMVYGDDSVGRLQGTGPVYSMISSFMDLRLEERTFSLLNHFNTVLGRQRTAKNKTAAWLHLKLPVVVPLSPLVRLYSEANPSTCMDNLLSDFQHLNAGKSISSDSPLRRYFKVLQQTQDPHSTHNRSLAVDLVSSKLVPDHLLYHRALKGSTSYSMMHQLQTILSSQMAMWSLYSYLLKVTPARASDVALDLHSGFMQQYNFVPGFLDLHSADSPFVAGFADFARPISSDLPPFRLTPNMCRLLDPFHLGGHFTTSMAVCALCLNDKKVHMQQLLELYGWGDYLCWEVLSGVESRCSRDVRCVIKEKVQDVMDRLDKVAPPRGQMDDPALEPVTQAVSDLIDRASSSLSRGKMQGTWDPWL